MASGCADGVVDGLWDARMAGSQGRGVSGSVETDLARLGLGRGRAGLLARVRAGSGWVGVGLGLGRGWVCCCWGVFGGEGW